MTCFSVEGLPDLLLRALTSHDCLLGILWFEVGRLLYRRRHTGKARPRARTRSKLKITRNPFKLKWKRDSQRW